MDVLAPLFVAAGLLVMARVDKDLLFPPNLMLWVWLLTFLGMLFLAGDYYPVAAGAYAIALLGLTSFAVGGLAARVVRPMQFLAAPLEPIPPAALWLMVGCFALALPFYAAETLAVAATDDFLVAIREVRVAQVEAAEFGEKLVGPIANFAALSLYVAMLCYVARPMNLSGKLLVVASFAVAIAYGLPGGSKGPVVNLILSLLILGSISSAQGIRWSRLILAGLLVVTVFSGGLYVINLAMYSESDVFELVYTIYRLLRAYWLGGFVALGQVWEDPGTLGTGHNVSRFFLETANSLGASFTVPSINLGYVNISDSEDTNVYTMFFSYLPYGGSVGVAALMMFYGFVTSRVYMRARDGDARFQLLYPVLALGIIFSFSAERFLLTLNPTLKAVVFFWGAYLVLPKLARKA